MKLQVTQENLAKALSHVSRVATTRGTLPILSNVLLKTVGNRLSIAATNLDIAITQYIGAKVTDEGGVTVPARLTQDFVSSLPSGVIDLELEGNKLHISTDKYTSVINGISDEDYPVMPDIEEGTSWKLSIDALREGLQQVVFAASNDEARPVLTGVYLHTHDSNLYMVATDSYRLAEKRVSEIKQDVKLLVPSSSLQELLRLLSDQTGDISITHDDQQVQFTVNDISLVTRLIEGTYPDYRKLIPTNFETQATLKRSEFVNITKVSSLFARESAGSVTVTVSEKDKQVSIRSIASQIGENTAAAEADVNGDGSITLNSRYILDALNVLQGDNITFSFNGKLEPSLLNSENNDDYNHVIMPLKS